MTIADDMRAASLGELARTKAQLKTANEELDQCRVQLAGCLCAAEGTGAADTVKQGDYAWTPALQLTVELRRVVMKDQEALTAAESATLELRRELTDERYRAFQAEERSKDLASKLDKALAELEQLRTAGSAVVMPSWSCPYCNRTHPMTVETCGCYFERFKIMTSLTTTGDKTTGEPEP